MTHATNLTSDRPRIIVVGSGQKPAVASAAAATRELIEAHAEVVVWDLAFATNLNDVDADWALVFGGDGSILRAVNQMAYRQRPLLSVNLGKLGFLAGVRLDELPAVLPQVCNGQLRVVEHLMFECSLMRNDETQWTELGLNEVAILSGAPFTMLDVNLHIDKELVTTYSCDGLIIATPVGSTAHCLSAGGPILRKDLDTFVITPLNPHTLTMRPLVDSADRVFELSVPSRNSGVHLVIDGRDRGLLKPGDRICIRRAKPRCTMFEPPGRSYYRTLREKLGWNGRFDTK